MIDLTTLPLRRAQCCRSWPVSGLVRMGRCGYCNEVPVIVGMWDE